MEAEKAVEKEIAEEDAIRKVGEATLTSSPVRIMVETGILTIGMAAGRRNGSLRRKEAARSSGSND